MSAETSQRSGIFGALTRLLRRAPTPAEPEQDQVVAYLAALQEMAARMKADVPKPELLATLAEQSALAIDCDVALIRLVEGDGRGLVVYGVHGVAIHRVAGLLGAFSPVTETFRTLWPGALAAFDLQAGVPPVLTMGEYTELTELDISQLLVLPLHHRGQLVGRLDLGRAQGPAFSIDDRAAATVLAGIVASAVSEPAGSAQSADTDILEASVAFQRAVERQSSVRETLQGIVEAVRGITESQRCYGLLWSEPRHAFVPSAVSGIEPHLLDALKTVVLAPATIPAVTHALTSGEPVLVEDAGQSELLPGGLARTLHIGAAIVTVLRDHQGHPLGALLLDYAGTDHEFGDREVKIVSNMALHASVVLENALLAQRARLSAERLALVNEIGVELASLADPAVLFERVYRRVASVIDAPRFCMGLLSPNEQDVEYRYAVGGQVAVQTVATRLGEDPLSWVLRSKRRTMASHRHAQDRSDWFPPVSDIAPSQSMIAIPMLVGQRAIGVMAAESEAPGAYSDAELELLATIGVQTAAAIENARLYGVVQERGELRGKMLDQVLNRQEAERKMLVDDIHNDTLQDLASSLFRIDLMSQRVPQVPAEETQKELQDVRDSLAENIDRLRRLIFQIRPSTLDILGLGPALQEYFGQLRDESGIQAMLDVELPSRLEGDLETAIYRIVQETIEHVREREGVSRIVVRIRQRQDKVVVTIADDGRGLDPSLLGEPSLAEVGGSGSKMSLLTLKERAELAGGQIRMASRVGGGATIQVLLPNRSA
ncbi:MAG TPA: GAF domain-containing protein [Thermomicrobiaceae bacterium]|nr:GAF domain-containing protein [Thermomicrobiaceae bacterium]